MQFTQEHDEIRRTLRAIIERDINPYVDQWEEDGIFPAHEVFKKLGRAGLLGINKPVEYGGMGLDYSYAMVMAEELGHITCGSVPMAIGVQTDMATPALARYGSDDLRKEFLAPSIAGDFVACLGVSEVGAGSDVASLKTTARRVGGDYVINGGKMWTTNGTQADWMCLLANTGEGAAHKNKSLIVVPMKTKGIEIVKKLNKHGMRASDTVQTFFDEVKVPVRYTIGQPGQGFIYQMQQFQEERLWGAISAVVGMERLITETAEYTRERKVFGRPLLDNQIIHFKLAELSTEVELVRSLCYRACEEYLDGKDVVMLASMAKLKAGRLPGVLALSWCSDGAAVAVAGADPDNRVDRADEDLAVADLAGAGGVLDGAHHGVHAVVVDDDLEFQLLQEFHGELRAAVALHLALLAAEAPHLAHGHADDAGWPAITVVDPHTGLGDDEAPRTGLLSSSLIAAPL